MDNLKPVKLDEVDDTFNQIKLVDLTIKKKEDTKAESESDTEQVKDETVKVKSEHPQEDKPASRTSSEHTCQHTKLEDEQDEIKVKTEKEVAIFGIARANEQTPDFASLSDDQFTPISDSMQIPPDLQDLFNTGNIFNPHVQCVPPPPYKQPMKTSSKRHLDETPYMETKRTKTDIYNKNMNCGGTITEAPTAENGELDLNGRNATANTTVSTTNNVMNTDLVKQTVFPGIYDYPEKSTYVNSPSGSSGYFTSPHDDVQSPNRFQLTYTSDYGGSPQDMPFYPRVRAQQPQYRSDSKQPTQHLDTSSDEEQDEKVEKQAFWDRVVSEWPLEKLKNIDEDKDT